MIKPGDIAMCKRGILGLILHKKNDKYIGIKLTEDSFGRRWESTNPVHVGNIFIDLKLRLDNK